MTFLSRPLLRLPTTRRVFLCGAGLAAGAVALGGARGQPLPDRMTIAGGFRVIRARTGMTALRGPGHGPTPIWGYDGTIPGPTIRAGRGEEVKVRLVNDLGEPTTLHWHGVRLANPMDGVADLTQPAIAPGASFDYRFVAPDAGTFWYHAQVDAPRQQARGLYGALIVDEAEPVDVDRDIALVFGDWRLGPTGTIVETTAPEPAANGDRVQPYLTVNGLHTLDIPVKSNERLRVRVLNAATARVLSFRLDRHRAIVMAIDGEPAEPFAAQDNRFTLGPGNRIDVFIDATLEPGSSAALTVSESGRETTMARLAYEAGPPARPEPRTDLMALPPNPLPERIDFEHALKLDLQVGASGDGAPLFTVTRGRAVMLGLVNRTAVSYAMHPHGHHFRLLDRLDDGWKPFWLDTLVVPAGQTMRIVFVAD
ncbi:MAG TPA: multicopper oxidase domain-containing protein, partial [Xanthobacteraceae bacterium]|nr:multicopper oxidase domain-containing protein [Xanthobacteraceae bacterium]